MNTLHRSLSSEDVARLSQRQPDLLRPSAATECRLSSISDGLVGDSSVIVSLHRL